MKKLNLILFLFIISIAAFGQKAKSSGARKSGNYKVLKVVPDNNMASDETRITFTFVGPDDKPAKSHIKIICNNDSAWPVIDSKGCYTAELDPGKYKMRFSVPFWNEVITDSINLKRKSATTILVKFDPQVIKAGSTVR